MTNLGCFCSTQILVKLIVLSGLCTSLVAQSVGTFVSTATPFGYNSTLTLLKDGRILVTGGGKCSAQGCTP